MKKIYSKFVKNRNKEFQIETAIWHDEGKKIVSKRNLCEEGKNHIKQILETYSLYSKSGLVCEAYESGDMICFEYIEGSTFEDELISAMKSHKKDEVEKLILQYNKLVDEVCAIGEKDPVTSEEVINNILGITGTGVEKYSNVIFDLTFDNIIFGGQTYKVIDYEWRFSFGVEKEFIKFRAVYAFVMKFKSWVVELYSMDEFYSLFDINGENMTRYLEYNTNFITYVYGKRNYNIILKQYEKMSIELFEENTMCVLKNLQKRKIENVTSYEDMFFDKLLDIIEQNRDCYDDYSKFFKVTKKIKAITPNGYTECQEFVEEFNAYINDLYSMVKFYKENTDDLYNMIETYKRNCEQIKSRSIKHRLGVVLHRLTHRE